MSKRPLLWLSLLLVGAVLLPVGATVYGQRRAAALEVREARLRIEEGHRLVGTKGCYACHRIGDRGAGISCDLSRVGRRREKVWMASFIRNPQAVRPGAPMPNLGLSPEEAYAIASYLASRR